ncbi:Uncharacterized protein FKW44_015616 [Caligus rogercresseyi]|uniref:HAT C-terminal dimerisation domain-containing protein n=1 Tax=Caligus rogercresseyi TaxID=217165 RepID=A0A7T8H0M8_CALRO|nr:Uncharacterized protein FKW44_015616 [Caligus rogercresseyi]
MALEEARMDSAVEIKAPLNSISVLPLYVGDLAALKTQYQAVVFHPWTTTDDCHAEAFWVEVFNYRDSSGEQAFRDLAQFTLSLLAMPLSNADVERVFSQMALVKSKLRNRIGQETLSSILHVRYGLCWQGKCCRDFEPTADMLLRFNSRMYEKSRPLPMVLAMPMSASEWHLFSLSLSDDDTTASRQ